VGPFIGGIRGTAENAVTGYREARSSTSGWARR